MSTPSAMARMDLRSTLPIWSWQRPNHVDLAQTDDSTELVAHELDEFGTDDLRSRSTPAFSTTRPRAPDPSSRPRRQ